LEKPGFGFLDKICYNIHNYYDRNSGGVVGCNNRPAANCFYWFLRKYNNESTLLRQYSGQAHYLGPLPAGRGFLRNLIPNAGNQIGTI
jgi:hypothetical protein